MEYVRDVQWYEIVDLSSLALIEGARILLEINDLVEMGRYPLRQL